MKMDMNIFSDWEHVQELSQSLKFQGSDNNSHSEQLLLQQEDTTCTLLHAGDRIAFIFTYKNNHILLK